MRPTSPKAYAAILVAPVLVAIAGLLYWSHAPEPIRGLPAAPTPIAANSPPSISAPATAATPTQPRPTPQVLPVSNAFTTLEDYRRRGAAAPKTLVSDKIQPAARTPETELGHVTFMVRDYRLAFGSNPVGSNREITRALMGNNPRGVKFLDPASVSLDERGQLLDAWGRPYFFHALSGTTMEIRSAGPDGKIFTDDDLVR